MLELETLFMIKMENFQQKFYFFPGKAGSLIIFRNPDINLQNRHQGKLNLLNTENQ